MHEIKDFIVGGRYNHKTKGPCTVLIGGDKHSARWYPDSLLVQYVNNSSGWHASEGHPLIPAGYEKLTGESDLQWVDPSELDFEKTDGYEVDE